MGYEVTTEICNPKLNAWSPGPPMAEKRYSHTASVIEGGNEVLVTGGWNGDKVLDSTEILP